MGLLISMEKKEKTATPLKASKWHCLAQRRDWRCDFLVYFVADYGGNFSSFASQGNLLGPILFFAVYRLSFSCASAGPTSVIQSA